MSDIDVFWVFSYRKRQQFRLFFAWSKRKKLPSLPISKAVWNISTWRSSKSINELSRTVHLKRLGRLLFNQKQLYFNYFYFFLDSGFLRAACFVANGVINASACEKNTLSSFSLVTKLCVRGKKLMLTHFYSQILTNLWLLLLFIVFIFFLHVIGKITLYSWLAGWVMQNLSSLWRFEVNFINFR